MISALEEQNELRALERQARVRKLRVAATLGACVMGLLGAAFFITAGAAPARYVCRETRLEHDVFVYPGGRMQRPADTWTRCEWRSDSDERN